MARKFPEADRTMGPKLLNVDQEFLEAKRISAQNCHIFQLNKFLCSIRKKVTDFLHYISKQWLFHIIEWMFSFQLLLVMGHLIKVMSHGLFLQYLAKFRAAHPCERRNACKYSKAANCFKITLFHNNFGRFSLTF